MPSNIPLTSFTSWQDHTMLGEPVRVFLSYFKFKSHETRSSRDLLYQAAKTSAHDSLNTSSIRIMFTLKVRWANRYSMLGPQSKPRCTIEVKVRSHEQISQSWSRFTIKVYRKVYSFSQSRPRFTIKVNEHNHG